MKKFNLTQSSKKDLFFGVIGYSTQKFDRVEAKEMIVSAFDKLEKQYKNHNMYCVSGWSDLGIPGLAYEEASRRGWKTVGIAPEKVKDYKLYPVNIQICVGSEWGDESNVFLDNINVLIKIGGGKQLNKEKNKAKQKGIEILEYDLKTISEKY